MGILARLKLGWALSMDSLRVLRRNPSLALFPLVSGIAGAVFIALLSGGSWVLNLFEGSVAYVVLFVLYLGTSFITAFFNAGLVYCARETFEGRSPTFRDGIDAAWAHRTPLFIWALISATVGLILQAIEGQDNVVARIVAAFVSVAWSILTYFVVPVIVFEDVGVTEMFRRSGETFKSTWGETAGASFGVGLVTGAATLVGLVVAATVSFALTSAFGAGGLVVVLVIAALFLLAMYLLATALGAVAKTALYVYATEGKRPPEFENVDFRRGAD